MLTDEDSGEEERGLCIIWRLKKLEAISKPKQENLYEMCGKKKNNDSS